MATRRQFLQRSTAAGAVVATPQILSLVTAPAYAACSTGPPSNPPRVLDDLTVAQSADGTVTGPASNVIGGSREARFSSNVFWSIASGQINVTTDSTRSYFGLDFGDVYLDWPSSTTTFATPLDLSGNNEILMPVISIDDTWAPQIGLTDSTGATSLVSISPTVDGICLENFTIDISDVTRIHWQYRVHDDKTIVRGPMQVV